jgi:hypothetical protein
MRASSHYSANTFRYFGTPNGIRVYILYSRFPLILNRRNLSAVDGFSGMPNRDFLEDTKRHMKYAATAKQGTFACFELIPSYNSILHVYTMKPLRDLSWPRLVPTDRLHTTRSSLSLKRRAKFFHFNRDKRSDPCLWSSFEGDSTTYAPIRELSPRPESDSRTPSPSLQTDSINQPLARRPFEEAWDIGVESISPMPPLPLSEALDQSALPSGGLPLLSDTPDRLSEQGSATEGISSTIPKAKSMF